MKLSSNKERKYLLDPGDKEILRQFTRQELREYAKVLGVKRGRDKSETINNLVASGLARVTVRLGG